MSKTVFVTEITFQANTDTSKSMMSVHSSINTNMLISISIEISIVLINIIIDIDTNAIATLNRHYPQY